ncbi:ECF transporter S component [Dysgonomonas sp. 216]|uniref:ECF transporter S component n=1 Tax=Dysgonomonas sp. 216 TaxID=2302934 RepID=UPI0013D1263B|nr:ECF transporter S component [Dysgonomonas sp. 216]NDW18827.1 ECF transporter S component [Dysgonomonas sp. 216]
MATNVINLYSLTYKNIRTYLITILFVAGNIALPQLVHLIPKGGLIFLPIYFFTLIAAYKYGWKAGLLTAILSPLTNHLLFHMPALNVLPIIMVKSCLLALSAGLAANYFKRISIPILALVVLSYQLIGTVAEWLLVNNFYIAIQDFRIGIPGMLLQIFGGYLFIKHLIKN